MNYRHPTGDTPPLRGIPSAQYESLLEYDHQVQLICDPRVRTFIAQPITLRYEHEGKSRRYTPDALVHFNADANGVTPPSELREVKTRQDLANNHDKLTPGFRAAETYAAEQGWIFRIVTEEDIRTPELPNLHFLLAYMDGPVDSALAEELLDAACARSPIRVRDLAQPYGDGGDTYWKVLHTIWVLIARRELTTDLTVTLDRDTLVWVEAQPGHP